MRAIMVAAMFALSGCATPNTGVVTLEGGVLSLSRHGMNSFSSQTGLRQEAMTEARAYCADRNQQFEMVELVEAQPPYILGRYPGAEVRFRCAAGS